MSNEHRLASIVGEETYEQWLNLLRELVPSGRTHRLAVLIAGLLRFSVGRAQERDEHDEASFAETVASLDDEPDDVIVPFVVSTVQQLFADAGVEDARTSTRGERYHLSEEAAEEFVRWYDRPWE